MRRAAVAAALALCLAAPRGAQQHTSRWELTEQFIRDMWLHPIREMDVTVLGAKPAQRKGFSMAGGILGGLLLGPLAFLMFFVSGITRSDMNRKCPQCAEFVKAEAKVCKHCGSELPPAIISKYGSASIR